MSNHLAIATVTAAIGQIAHAAAQSAVAGVGVRFGRPNATDTGARVNIYLYQVTPNAARRNADLPTRGGDGRLSNRARAALDLHYLVSFYGNAQVFEPDRMAGAIARDFHARPSLDRATLDDAVASVAELSGSDLRQSVERVSVTPMALSLDDLSRLWSAMIQAPHALSVVYQAGVVIIDALDGGPTPLPVLRRGEDGRGPVVGADRIPRLGDAWVGFSDTVDRQPRLASLRAAALGTVVHIVGSDLDGDTLALTFDHQRRAPFTLEIAPTGRTAAQITLAIPDDSPAATTWSAGLYAVTPTIERGTSTVTGPVWPLLLAPRITALSPNPAGPVGGNVALTVTCRPQVLATQTARLRVGELDVAAAPRALDTDPLIFTLDFAPALSASVVRLTVDGAESAPVLIDPVTGDFAFDPSQRLTIA